MVKMFYLLLLLTGSRHLYSQAIEPDLQHETQWTLINRTATPIDNNGKKAISLNEMAANGMMLLKGTDFSNGIIELDIKGSNKFQQSFVGFAFHCQDAKTYEAVYFRPFNFKAEDALRRSHAVQYISMPDYDWEKLRNTFPGRYENKIAPAPGADDWFHVKIAVKGKQVAVFVNGDQQAALEVEKLSTNSNGGLALWVGNSSAGSFANLTITQTAAGDNLH
jgi:hypothetical protein